MPLPSEYRKLERTSAKNKVLQQLQTWIVDGTLLPGEKILDTELAEALGVSRTPVREALQILEWQGFVEMRPGKETRVSLLQPEDVPNIYKPLIALETLAVELAVPHLLEDDLTQLSLVNEQFHQAIIKNQSYAAMELDEQFHQIIHRVAGNPYILSFNALLHLHLRRLKFIFFQHIVPAIASVEEHRAILAALSTRDVAFSVEAMRQNWQRPMQEVALQLETKKEGVTHGYDLGTAADHAN